MPFPGAIYAYDEDGTRLFWPAVKPPPRWRWCGSSPVARLHFKPDDGARCDLCGEWPEQEAREVAADIEEAVEGWTAPK